MAIIRELSPHMADLIAAGEVVERPSSVAKELIENSIDAGAKRITVEIENGGISFFRIADDGFGMSAEDAPTAFKRHATSKLREEKDLAAIGTLGFRGEALAAISSVTRIDLFTRQKGEIAGRHLKLEAGKLLEHEEAGCPEGTTIIVRDLFFNTPARMKFLKKDFTEAGYVLGVVHHAALSHPEIAFNMIRDGKPVFSSDGKGKLLTPVFAVFGKEMTADMLEVPRTERDGISVYGYITKPHAGRTNRSMQHFFVNGRYVKNRVMQASLEEAYRGSIITGKYPSGALFLEMPLGNVDVNVHPAKTEVKFSEEKPVFSAVYIACKNALAASDNIPEIKAKPEKESKAEKPEEPKKPEMKITYTQEKLPAINNKADEDEEDDFSGDDFFVSVPPKTEKAYSYNGNMLGAPALALKNEKAFELVPKEERNVIPWPKHMKEEEPEKPEPVPEKEEKTARVIGECFKTYLVAEDEDGLVLIDKHAAHERMLFNKLKEEADIPQQELITPVIFELTAEEAAAVKSAFEDIRKAGFDIGIFGENSFSVRSAPAYIDAGDVKDVIAELAEKTISSREIVPDKLDELIHMVACKAAIKAGKETGITELQSLCDKVLNDDNLRSCPHGRPTTVRLKKYELDKLFKRVNQ